MATDTTAANPKIQVSHLNFYYGATHTLHDVSVEIATNRVTALIGPSGCGKSTFLRTLNRIYEAARGTRAEGAVLLDGRSIFDITVTELRRRVGMVFQKANPFPMTIFDNVAYGLRIGGIRNQAKIQEIVERSLRRAALWEEVKDALTKPAHALSGGQQQRLCIARALAIDPEVLLLDEPCSGLDPIATGKIEDLLFYLKQQCTLILVTHNMQQAARTSDFTGFFLVGRLVEFGPTETIFKRPAKRETEDYITGRFG